MNEKHRRAPILEQLQHHIEQHYLSFHIPGHKSGAFIDPQARALLGEGVFRLDLTELPGLDDLHQPQGMIGEAQQLAAELFGAKDTWFLINGTTGGLEAGILTLCNDGQELLVPRNVHKSVIYGLVMSGAQPRYIPVELCSNTGLTLGVSVSKLRESLNLYKEAKGLIVLNPSYQGIAPPLEQSIHTAHQFNIPVLVDEAHGGHFSSSSQFPLSGLEAGGDLVVQSAHKMLGSLTQTSFLHLQGERVNRETLKRGLQMLQTTSPSYPLLASLDGARRNMALCGTKLWESCLGAVREIRDQIDSIPGIDLVKEEDLAGEGFRLDPTKITISAIEIGLTGLELAQLLREKYRVQVEYGDQRYVVIIITPGNEKSHLVRLQQGISEISRSYRPYIKNRVKDQLFQVPPQGKQVLTPRQSWQIPTRFINLSSSIGKIAGDVVCPYPPGIPLLCPGEEITPEVVDYLEWARRVGVSIHGLDAGGQLAVLL